MKRIIKNYLIKRLTGHPKHYYFLRWLSDLVTDKNELDDVCASVANWLYNSGNGKLINHLNDLFVIDNIVYLYTYRPGFWIGKEGKTLESLKDSLNYNIDGVKIHNYKVYLIEITNKPYSKIMGYVNYYSNNW